MYYLSHTQFVLEALQTLFVYRITKVRRAPALGTILGRAQKVAAAAAGPAAAAAIAPYTTTTQAAALPS